MKSLSLLLAAALLGACEGNDPIVPDLDVRGTYTLMELSFDPQGSLPNVDLLVRLATSIPRLVMANNGRAQLVFEDPATGLVTTAAATYAITRSGEVTVDFGESSSLQRATFLSKRMTFDYDEAGRSLTFAGTSPDGVDRQRLLAVVPEWSDEQLFNPVPGTLRAVYRVQVTP